VLFKGAETRNAVQRFRNSNVHVKEKRLLSLWPVGGDLGLLLLLFTPCGKLIIRLNKK